MPTYQSLNLTKYTLKRQCLKQFLKQHEFLFRTVLIQKLLNIIQVNRNQWGDISIFLEGKTQYHNYINVPQSDLCVPCKFLILKSSNLSIFFLFSYILVLFKKALNQFQCCLRKGSDFILLHMALQFSWRHLLKGLFFPPIELSWCPC